MYIFSFDFSSASYRGRIRMILGKHDIIKNETTQVNFTVIEVVKHQDFDNKTFQNDIALFKLDSPVTVSSALYCLFK